MHPSPRAPAAEECYCWSERRGEERGWQRRAERSRAGRGGEERECCCKASSFCSGKTCVFLFALPKCRSSISGKIIYKLKMQMHFCLKLVKDTTDTPILLKYTVTAHDKRA